MKISTLQAQIQVNRRIIYDLEHFIKCAQGEIRWHKVNCNSKDLYKHKYREIESLKKTLKKLVSLQQELRKEISVLVAEERHAKEFRERALKAVAERDED